MNYRKALKTANASIRHLTKSLESGKSLYRSIEAYQNAKIAELRKAIRLYKEDNRERAELVEDIMTKRMVIASLQAAVDARGDSLVELEADLDRAARRANTAEAALELAGIQIEQLRGHRIWLVIAVGMFIAKDAALYFGLL